MQLSFKLVCIVAAVVCFGLATFAIPSPARFQWQPAGLMFLTGVLFINA